MNRLKIAQNSKESTNILSILEKSIQAEDMLLVEKFCNRILHLYRFEIFKNFLDIAVTLCQENRLLFKVTDCVGIEINAGSCRTIANSNNSGAKGLMSKIGRLFRSNAKHIIAIRHIGTDTIIHEIAHMIEYEFSSLFSIEEFSRIFMNEVDAVMRSQGSNAIGLKDSLRRIIIDGVDGYSDDSKNNEYFARFFELFGSTIEVASHTSYKPIHNIEQMYNAFPQTLEYINEQMGNCWKDIIDRKIAIDSKALVDKHIRFGSSNASWKNKVDPIHAAANTNTFSKQIGSKGGKWTKSGIVHNLHDHQDNRGMQNNQINHSKNIEPFKSRTKINDERPDQ